MYGLDINFLNDRADRPTSLGPRPAPAPSGSRLPMFVGVGAAAFLLAAVGVAWLITQNRIRTLEARQAQLDSELAELQTKLNQLDTIRAQTAAIQSESQALATVFNRILPWSAMLQDVRQRIPSRVQIENIEQTEGTPTQPPTAEGQPAPPPPAGGIVISGLACSFNDVNDFVLTLQRSPFLVREQTRLVSAELQDTDRALGRCPGDPTNIQAVQLVQYSIRSNLTDIPASELVDELERRGTIGLVSRLRALQQTGVIQP